MASSLPMPRRPRLILLALSVLLGLCAAAAMPLRDSPRWLVMLTLAAGILLAWHWRLSGQIGRQPRDEPLPAPPGDSDRLAQQQALNTLEAQLEYAPVALFRIHARQVSPLNSRARRLIAPGYASDRNSLYEQLSSEAPNKRRLISFEAEHGTERALMSTATLINAGEAERVVALLPVESELEAETLKAWQQLVHVLTHEIMNSLTPVASLSRTANDILAESRDQVPASMHDNLSISLAAISRRADSLADFVATYRSLSAMPPPQPERIVLHDLFARLSALVGPAWRQRGGEAHFSVDPVSLELRGDAGQLEQALINLATNAYEATQAQGQGLLTVSARLAQGSRLRIEVADNGPGVPEALVGQIFTPFFSTKSKGRGVGLALVRQLVHGNGGTVRYARRVSGGGLFIITF